MATYYVTNYSDAVLTDSWDGKPFTFEPGKTTEVPEEIVVHVFGYQAKDKSPYLARFGWAKTLNDIPEGIKKLEKFVISDTPPIVKNHSLPPVVERVPLPASKQVKGKVLSPAEYG
jgi:hypothetical protein